MKALGDFFGWSKNATRMLTGFAFGAVAIFPILWGGLWLVAVIFAFMCLCSREYVKMLEHKGFYPSLKIILFSNFIFATVAYMKRFDLVSIALTICTLSAFLWVLFRGRQPYIANVATTILGVVYCGWFPLHIIFLRDLSSPVYDSGLGFVIMMVTCVILTDAGCYYIGCKYGRHKLAPVISPNKTWEGSFGGGICSIVGAIVVSFAVNLPLYLAICAGLICTICAQIGDLCESLIKRDAGVKDSGHDLPGHGGFLDRVDSFILTIPVMFYFTKWFIMSDNALPSVINFLGELLKAY